MDIHDQAKRMKMDVSDQQMDDQSIDDQCGIDRTSDYSCTDPVLQCQGAEARLYRATYLGKSVMVKERFAKTYRHPTLDDQLRRERLKSEIRCMAKCRSAGVSVPPVYFVDPFKNRLVIGYIDNSITVREYIRRIQIDHRNSEDRQRLLLPLAEEIGKLIATIHENNVIHGDLTTSNMLIQHGQSSDEEYRLVLIDFGLSYVEHLPEDKGVDLYVLEKAFLSTHPDTESVFDRVLSSYGIHHKNGGKKVLAKLAEVRLRGRKREMIG